MGPLRMLQVMSRELYDWLVREKIADGALIAKWRKPGYEILCSLLAIQKGAPALGCCSCVVLLLLPPLSVGMQRISWQQLPAAHALRHTSCNPAHLPPPIQATTTLAPPRTAACRCGSGRRSSASRRMCR